MKISYENLFVSNADIAKIRLEQLKDDRLYHYANNRNQTNQISDAEISELYVKHVVIGNSVLTFARELIKKVEE